MHSNANAMYQLLFFKDLESQTTLLQYCKYKQPIPCDDVTYAPDFEYEIPCMLQFLP